MKTTIKRVPTPTNGIIAVGDIHGCNKHLAVMIDKIERIDLKDVQVIFLGDYIDRGPSSKDVLDQLIAFKERHPSTLFLRGNHEDMFLGFIGEDGLYGESYLYEGNGGMEFLREFGLHNSVQIRMSGYSKSLSNQEFKERIGIKYIDFILAAEMIVETDDYYFVHAGFRPGVPVEEQYHEDLVWIREEFIRSTNFWGKPVVVGHTPVKQVAVDQGLKIMVDTGCFLNYQSKSGKRSKNLQRRKEQYMLSAVHLRDKEITIVNVTNDDVWQAQSKNSTTED